MALQTRLIQIVGARQEWGLMWHHGMCNDGTDLHCARVYGPPGPRDMKPPEIDAVPSAWQPVCKCGARPPEDLAPDKRTRFSGTTFLFNTPSGKPEPGNIYEAPWYHNHGCCPWDNCDGRHLICILPNGHEWHMTGRASNCTMKQDRLHRCWVIREESPGVFHVDKTGRTCAAGAGSIMAGKYHGFLHHGVLTGC